MNWHISRLAVFLCLAVSAPADLILTIDDDGTGTVNFHFHGSGVDTSGLTPDGSGSLSGWFAGNFGIVGAWEGAFDAYRAGTVTLQGGLSASNGVWTSAPLATLGIDVNDAKLWLPQGYAGGPLNDRGSISGSLASVGIGVGLDVRYSWVSGGVTQNVRIHQGDFTTVPEASSFVLSLLLMGLSAGRRRKLA